MLYHKSGNVGYPVN